MIDTNGDAFWVPVRREGRLNELPVIDIQTNDILSCHAQMEGFVSNAALATGARRDKATKSRQLIDWHAVYGHTTGHRLYATLIEKGLTDYTQAQCNTIGEECVVCRVFNIRHSRVPKCADSAKADLRLGDVVFQDLIVMSVRGQGGYEYVSVIVDWATRRMSAMSLKKKNQALIHDQHFSEWVVAGVGKVKKLRTDNGGDRAYEEYCMRIGTVHETGASYAPESQAVVGARAGWQ